MELLTIEVPEFESRNDEWTHKFGPGEWVDEPDIALWVNCETAFLCMILRHEDMGHLCGYVCVPPTHPVHGLDYGTVMEMFEGVPVELTFSDWFEESPPYCLTPFFKGIETKFWVLGFDNGHFSDLVPGMVMKMPNLRSSRATYKNIPYTRRVAGKLALWLDEVQCNAKVTPLLPESIETGEVDDTN